MMKRDAFHHPKIRRLARRLKVPIWGARGLAESLWHVTATHAPAGDIGRMLDDDIADQIGWDDEADVLIDALVEAGLVDRCQDHRLVVHDWKDHADRGVHQKVERRGASFASPNPPSQPKNGEVGAHREHDDDTEHTRRDEETHTTPHVLETVPAQAKAQAQAQAEAKAQAQATAQARHTPTEKSATEPPGFVRWWKSYPGKRTEKQRCLAIWRGKKPTADGQKRDLEPMADEIVAAVKRQKAAHHWRGSDGRDFIPNASTWLYNGNWDDEVRPPPASESSGSGLVECGPRPVKEVDELLRTLDHDHGD